MRAIHVWVHCRSVHRLGAAHVPEEERERGGEEREQTSERCIFLYGNDTPATAAAAGVDFSRDTIIMNNT